MEGGALMGFAVIINTTTTGSTLPAAEAERRIGEGLRRVAFNYRSKMQSSNVIPVNTGALRSSITAQFNATRGEAVVGTPLVYAIVMEQGRRAGSRMPPVDALIPWVRRKLKPKFDKKITGDKAKQLKKTRKQLNKQRGIARRTSGIVKTRAQAKIDELVAINKWITVLFKW